MALGGALDLNESKPKIGVFSFFLDDLTSASSSDSPSSIELEREAFLARPLPAICALDDLHASA